MYVLFVVYCSNTHGKIRTNQFAAATQPEAEQLAKQWLDKDAFHYLFREESEEIYRTNQTLLTTMANSDDYTLYDVIELFHNHSYIEIQTEMYQHT